jgi:hypothetical protein
MVRLAARCIMHALQVHWHYMEKEGSCPCDNKEEGKEKGGVMRGSGGGDGMEQGSPEWQWSIGARVGVP